MVSIVRATDGVEGIPAGFPILLDAQMSIIEPAFSYLLELATIPGRSHATETLRTYSEHLHDWFDSLEQSGLDWTVVRPGGLSEDDSRSEREGVVFSGADQQERDSIPRRLVARVCLEALAAPASIGRIVEVTSSPAQPPQPLSQWLTGLAPG